MERHAQSFMLSILAEFSVFGLFRSHFSMPSSFSLHFYCTIQQLLGDCVMSGDMAIPQ